MSDDHKTSLGVYINGKPKGFLDAERVELSTYAISFDFVSLQNIFRKY